MTGGSESPAILVSLEPGATATFVARVFDQTNQLVPNVSVELRLAAVPNSAGHRHGDNSVIARTGTLATGPGTSGGQVLTGNTGNTGLVFTYNLPAVSGDIEVNATCPGRTCTQEGPKQVWVGVKGLEPIVEPVDPASGVLYTLIRPNADSYHPSNHYLNPQSAGRLIQLAYLYRTRFLSDPPLHLNDASLERGGLFDIEAKDGNSWTTPHKTHRFGTEIDIRANPAQHATTSIPTENFKRFIEFVRQVGGTTLPANGPAYANSDNQHFHVCLRGACQ